MKLLKFIVVVTFVAALALFIKLPGTVNGQIGPTEAPTGFDTLTNGFVDQEEMDEAREDFSEVETIEDGLGPTFNAPGCAACHLNPVTGGSSQITEVRAGHFNGTNFVPHPGNTLIQSNAIDPSIQEFILDGNEVTALRSSLTLLGDGFVECIDSATIMAIARNQPAQMRGQVIFTPVLEAPGQARVGRFGWKAQLASLLSFSSDAYLNEMGITNPFNADESTSNGNPVDAFDVVEGMEDDGTAIGLFSTFMRSLKAPSRDTVRAATPDAIAGSALFDTLGCAVCHVRNVTTAPPGTVINGGQLVVPPALGNKIIHPFSDFLLHDLGPTGGDGIVQEGMSQTTMNKLRTANLWGLRTRPRLMHDLASLTLTQAILRHGGEATAVTNSFRALSDVDKGRLIAFLRSL